tara:strand:+ start:577 stop:1179 length:603 start_codon:yes stop_codon:yes gene_type:complete
MIIPAIEQNIHIAKEALKNREPIIYPTDTLYSFGAIATDSNTISIINNLKKRQSPLSIVLSKISQIEDYGLINKQYESLIDDILPGKFTILLKSKAHNLSPLVQSDSELIGIRIPDHSFTIKLVDDLLEPIITTSINIHGQNPLVDIDKIEQEYPQIKIFYDKNRLNSKGSTILNLSQKNINIVREGDAILPILSKGENN